MRFYDAHNHLQDERLDEIRERYLAGRDGVVAVRMVVNGSTQSDWPDVRALAAADERIIPAFGYHPWYVNEATPDWSNELAAYLESPRATIGEIGLDGARDDVDFSLQRELFLRQLGLAAERNLPASIHCIKAWGEMVEVLSSNPRPARGFVLHSFGGSAQLVPKLASLGAYFSFPGAFLDHRSVKKHAAFREVPRERVLVETDAPDQPIRTRDMTGERGDAISTINHPNSIESAYRGLALLLEMEIEALADQVEKNFERLFGS